MSQARCDGEDYSAAFTLLEEARKIIKTTETMAKQGLNHTTMTRVMALISTCVTRVRGERKKTRNSSEKEKERGKESETFVRAGSFMHV